ncbi:hypothetical protein SLS64_001603 [Diaporthe eres]
MAYSSEVIDVSDSSEPGASSSRKHDRPEKDTQIEGPNKRQKLKRGSEPPMRKDTTMTPRPKRKKARNEINRHKASRTSNHQELKERAKALECELDSARQAHDDENRENQANLDWHATELKKLQARCSELADEMREQEQIAQTEHQENKALRRKLKDIEKDVDVFQLSCQNKDDELKGKEEVIAAKQKELEDSKQRSTSLEECLAQTDLALKVKDESIAAKQKELDKSKHESAFLRKSLAEKESALRDKNNIIDATQKQLDDSKHRSASFQESLAEAELALKGKDEVITALQEELKDSKRQSESVEECLSEMRIELNGKDETITALKEASGEKERALKASKRDQSDCRKELALRDEKLRSRELELDQANTARRKIQKENEALHVINDQNGHRNHNTLSREKKAKDALESLKTEHKDKTSKFEAEKAELETRCTELQGDLEAKEDEQNQMIAKFQLKLKTSRQQSQRYNYKEPDEKIKKDFANLESNIRQFVDKYARPVLNATDQELKTVWPNWSPQLRNFLASPLLCNLVLEAYVWECLVARIFAPGSNIWAGDLGRAMEKALRTAAGFESDLYIDFQYLRSSSSSLISRLNCAEFRPKYFDSDVKAMTSTLGKLCGLDEIDDSMKTDAMGIFKDAREFEIQLRMLKATYTLRMYKFAPFRQRLKYGFRFFDEEMDDRSLERKGQKPEHAPLVDFIMCPGLYKRGSNSGANYETKTCVVKMGVVCNASELFLKLRTSTSAQSSSTRAQKALFSGEFNQEIRGRTSRNHPSSTADKAKKGSSISDPFLVKAEEIDLQQDVDPLSTPGLTYGSPEPNSRDAAQIHSGTATNRVTRSRAPPTTDSNEHDGKSTTKSTNNHPYPTGAARGRGGGSSTKKTRQSKGSDPEADYVSKI